MKTLQTCIAVIMMGLILIMVLVGIASARESGHESGHESDRGAKLFAANAGGILFITGWGIANWDYGQETPSTTSEGWFGQGTDTGGADKLGHAYATYFLSHGLSHSCSKWGYSETEAPLYGSLSAFGLMGFMEVGDAFSSYGLSHEDFLMNAVGAFVGYATQRFPGVSERLDFRLEYTPSFDEPDILTDYNHMKFLAALKLGGFHRFSTGFPQYLEFHLGYYTRGYDDATAPRRYLYGGIGLNLSRIFQKRYFPRISSALRYLQVPHTDLQFRTSPL
ncbi:DUF2279 domain-containing protein [Desulfoluna sp.]|uniref:DUF2279 domain-containing protein n=1 Tax=Desulfoluna sp. TaxID=2045199 RepID=UPI00262EAB0A|nr:DUF2279 domain-containing protein [Desulfoluna sp.]